MRRTGRVLLLALDAADPSLVRRWAAEGSLPNLARLLGECSRAPVVPPEGVFVSANWPTIFTALQPDRHGYLCWDEVDHLTYEHRETAPGPDTVAGTPIWERLSAAGRRTVVLDVPHSWPAPIDGRVLVEWGCHDRHEGTRSWPGELHDELARSVGPHPVGCAPEPGRSQFAPCDYTLRADVPRSPAEELGLLELLREGVERKRQVSLRLLDEGCDVFISVFGETHCVGHQLFHVHDPSHPRHDPAVRAAMGVDPVLDIYRRVDAALGEHLERLEPDDTCYVLLSHGMVAHHDGTELLDPLLHRLERLLDDPEAFGMPTRLAAATLNRTPGHLRRGLVGTAGPVVAAIGRRRLDRAPAPDHDELPPRAGRRWYAVPNNSVSGAVRLNLAGREPQGRIAPDARAEVLRWLSERLREVVSLDSGRPIATGVVLADDVYRRSADDNLPDLFVEWDRGRPVERAWSPSTGTVVRPYSHWRTGDHIARGLLLATGPGISADVDLDPIRSADVGAIVAAAAGVDLPDADGEPVEALLPRRPDTADIAARSRRRRSLLSGAARSLDALERRARRTSRSPAARWEAAHPAVEPGLSDEVQGLAAAHHETRVMAERLADRMEALELQARIARTSAWLRQQPVEATTLISVVIPTCDRPVHVLQAVQSVLGQTYPNFEVLVVDDGTRCPAAESLADLDDPRLRLFATNGAGAAAARNLALDRSKGELVTYLDDDNRFDPDWLKAVAWTFDTRPEVEVAYGARLVDDEGRHHAGPDNGNVWLQLLPWDREAALRFNIVDMNVIAHRRNEVRFDDAVHCYADWDLLLSLTENCEAHPVPVVAAYYTTDGPERISVEVTDEVKAFEHARIRARHGATGPVGHG